MDLDAVASRYARLAGRMSETVAVVPDERWDAPSPCEDWTVRDVLEHVVGLHVRLLESSAAEAPAGPGVADDPAGAWEAASRATRTALSDPVVAVAEFDSSFGGVTSLAGVLSTFGAVDLIVHRWDIATGAGTEATIVEEDLDFVWDFVQDKGDMMRSPGGFGPALEVPEGVDEQTRVLAFLGRSA